VIGGDDRSGCARLTGRELAKNGCVILTGGCAVDGRSETKYAAIMGTLDAEQYGEGIARYIGIMPKINKDNFDFEYLSPRQFVIHSGLSSMDRDPLNGITPDVLICFAGGIGTICELAFGIAAGREAIFHDNCAQILLDQLIKSRRRAEIQRELSQVAEKWQSHLQLPNDYGSRITDIVTEYLHKAVHRVQLISAAMIVQAALQMLPNKLPDIPAFPGVPGVHYQQQIQKFASLWTALANDLTQ